MVFSTFPLQKVRARSNNGMLMLADLRPLHYACAYAYVTPVHTYFSYAYVYAYF